MDAGRCARLARRAARSGSAHPRGVACKAGARGGRATAGWHDTLEAASDARVELLLFQEGAEHTAWQCPRCGRVSAEGGPCPLDGTQMEERSDGLNLAVLQTLAHGGSALALRHYQDL